MKVTIDQDITKCRDCFYVTNSSQVHDCAFTSAPYPTTWYCRKKNNMPIYDEDKIDSRCPLISEFDRWWNASKYTQVINTNASMKQVAKDAWEAAKK